jgi:predicted small secreted protein
MKLANMMRILVAMLLLGALAGCGDTWQGLKKDTGENVEATGEAVEKAGEKIKE